MPRDEDLGHGAHADRVGAPTAHHPELRGRLVVRTGDGDVDAFAQVVVDRVRELAERFGVRPDHVREARAQPVVVRPAQGVGAHEVDVVGDDHEVAGHKGGVQAAASVRDDERVDAPRPQDADREADRGDVVALVVMEPPAHHRDVLPLEAADDELAGVSGGGAALPARDLRCRG